ncbi:PfkB family carbohydrate kinase [Algirhabdus cladophorae]|uniref:PfkB family carbohydrate kinase n=1 Tax=Algirhabdus cladophorae TaxID=3377108 RepID=UPI003B846595
MTKTVYCIGSVLWDVIGRTDAALSIGSDVGGRISRGPGGVALNIAMALTQQNLRAELVSVIGTDPDGATLREACLAMGLGCGALQSRADLPTDQYMAIEDANGVVSAIADAHSLEAAGQSVLAPFLDGTIGSDALPFDGIIALDGNLTESVLGFIATAPAFARADLRVAPASPGKATRLKALLHHPNASFYINLTEARSLGATGAETADAAAQMLVAQGCKRVIVTDGHRLAADEDAAGCCQTQPPQVAQARVTGAGDTLMAAHIAAELQGQSREAALDHACHTAAHFVSGED